MYFLKVLGCLSLDLILIELCKLNSSQPTLLAAVFVCIHNFIPEPKLTKVSAMKSPKPSIYLFIYLFIALLLSNLTQEKPNI